MSYGTEMEERAGLDGADAQTLRTGEDQHNDQGDNTSSRLAATPPFAKHDPSALRHYRQGYEMIPLNTPGALSRGGRPIGKAPKEFGWRRAPPLKGAEAADHMRSGHNVGVRLRPTDLVVDVDPRNFKPADDPLARLQHDLGADLTSYPTVKTGGGGLHIYMTKPDGLRLLDTHPDYEGIEFKSVGRQVVAAGSVHPGGGAYRWDDDPLAVPLSAVKEAPSRLIELATRPEVSGITEAGRRAPEDLALMLEGLDVMNYQEDASWLQLMMACHHATGGDGRSEWIGWSTGDPKYSDDEGRIGRRWDSLHANQDGARITEKTLFKALVEAQRLDLIPKEDPAGDFYDEPLDEAAEGQPDTGPLAQMNAGHFTVLTGGKYLVGRERQNHMTGQTEVEWYPDAAIAKHHDKQMVEIGDGKLTPMGRWWISNPNRRRYDAVVFDPAPGG